MVEVDDAGGIDGEDTVVGDGTVGVDGDLVSKGGGVDEDVLVDDDFAGSVDSYSEVFAKCDRLTRERWIEGDGRAGSGITDGFAQGDAVAIRSDRVEFVVDSCHGLATQTRSHKRENEENGGKKFQGERGMGN